MHNGALLINRCIKAWQNVRVIARDVRTQRIVHVRRAKNRIPTSGLNHLCDLLKGDSTNKLSHFAVGIGTNATQPTDTALQSEAFRGTITKMARGGGVLTITYFLPTTAANGQTVSEAGTFTAASGGVLFSRVVYTGIAKTNLLTITYIWTVTLSSAQVPTSGLNHLCDLLKGDSTARLTHMAVGIGTAPVIASQAALSSEVARVPIVTMTRTGGVLVISAYLPSVTANGQALTEAASFTAAAAGIMFSRAVHGAQAKANTNTITYVETVSFSASG